MPEDITSASVPAGNPEGGAPVEGGETASNGEGTIAKVLSEVLGKPFKDDESALKSVKDTFKYVGDVGHIKKEISRVKETTGLSQEEILSRLAQADQPTQSAQASVNDEVTALKQQLDEMSFYSERPDLKDYKATLNDIQSRTGQTLGEIAESESFKPLLEKARAFDESQKSKSVLESSPRLGRVKDKMTEAREAAKTGNQVGANKSAIGAVLDAFDMK